jgi:GAF domain-containing protein
MDTPKTLAEAESLLRRQQDEIRDLRLRLEEEHLARDLRQALTVVAATGTIVAPASHSRLQAMIVEAAARVLSAQAASLFLIDEGTQELVFEVGFGGKTEEMRKFRIPLGHGIVGLVAATCQPMIIGDAQNDPRLASDIARAVGYFPKSLFCIPLISRDRPIGVLELLDKEGGGSFGPADMEILGHFGNLATIAIEQSRANRNLAALLSEALLALGSSASEAEGQQLRQKAQALLGRLEGEDATYRRALQLAQSVHEIVDRGENELAAVQTILRGFADYLRSQAAPAFSLGGWR